MTGRPPIYTPDLARAVLERLAAGESLREICRDPDMPSRTTVNEWRLDNTDGFADRYARARDVGLDELADEVLEISDDGRNDWMEKLGEDGQPIGWQLNGEHVQRSKVRVDSRKWYLSKLAPKRYGERIQTAQTDTEGNDVEIDDATRAARLSSLLALAVERRDRDVNDLV